MPVIDTTSGGARLRRSISRPTKSDRHRRDERRHHGTQTRALRQKEHDGACGTAERRSHRCGPFGIAGQGEGGRARRTECDTCGQLCQGGRCGRADCDERRAEPAGEVQHQRHTGDRRGRQHHQLEEAGRSGDRSTGDDVADRAHQRKAGKKYNQACRDGHRRFEMQPQLGAERVEQDRRRGRDRTANRVLKEERQPVPVESPIDAVDRHGAEAPTRQASRLAPRVPAVANASAPQARVAIQRLYGCGAVMMTSSSSRACDGDTWPA